ncbi:lysostaphin resistance A-like protein [Lacticaseibacillus saniviri]
MKEGLGEKKQYDWRRIWYPFGLSLLIFELSGSLIITPLLDFLIPGHFWAGNIAYKSAELLVAICLNVFVLKAKIFLNISRPTHHLTSYIIVAAVLACFGIWLIISHPIRLAAGLTVGLIAALPEEFIWRGLVLGYLAEHLRGTDQSRAVRALLLSSILFGMYHLNNLRWQPLDTTMSQVVQVTGVGMVLGAAYLKSGNLLWPISIHFFWNFFLTLENGIGASADTSINWLLTVTVNAILCLIGTAIILFYSQDLHLMNKLEEASET